MMAFTLLSTHLKEWHLISDIKCSEMIYWNLGESVMYYSQTDQFYGSDHHRHLSQVKILAIKIIYS